MELLVLKKFVTKDEIKKHLASFALQELRRYANFHSSTTRPYIISSLNTYKVGLLAVDPAIKLSSQSPLSPRPSTKLAMLSRMRMVLV